MVQKTNIFGPVPVRHASAAGAGMAPGTATPASGPAARVIGTPVKAASDDAPGS
jgi:hypothetical protein